MITSVLVANRGEIASRIFNTLKTMGIRGLALGLGGLAAAQADQQGLQRIARVDPVILIHIPQQYRLGFYRDTILCGRNQEIVEEYDVLIYGDMLYGKVDGLAGVVA